MTKHFYKLLLWLYPAEFRRRFGAEMLDKVEARTGGSSGGGCTLLGLLLLLGALVGAVALGIALF